MVPKVRKIKQHSRSALSRCCEAWSVTIKIIFGDERPLQNDIKDANQN